MGFTAICRALRYPVLDPGVGVWLILAVGSSLTTGDCVAPHSTNMITSAKQSSQRSRRIGPHMLGLKAPSKPSIRSSAGLYFLFCVYSSGSGTRGAMTRMTSTFFPWTPSTNISGHSPSPEIFPGWSTSSVSFFFQYEGVGDFTLFSPPFLPSIIDGVCHS